MKLCAFAVPTSIGTFHRVGAVVNVTGAVDAADSVVVDLSLATRLSQQQAGNATAEAYAAAVVPPDMTAFIAGGVTTLEAARRALDWAMEPDNARGRDGEVVRHQAEEVRLLPAVPNPPMLRDFMAFEGHLRNIFPKLGREIPPEWFELPVYYKGNPASLGAHGDDIRIPDYEETGFDFEFEIAAVIGPPGIDIARQDAARHIYGFTIYNDFSARTIQQREMSVGLGPAKGKDFVGGHVLGPWLVTTDEIDDVYDLAMEARVNGELWASGTTADMHWRFEDMIAHTSMAEPLRAGEVFGSGTVGDGSAAEKGSALQPSDEIELSVAGLGTLRNRVV